METLRTGRSRRLASKFSAFTALLVFWVVATLLAYNVSQERFALAEAVLLLVVIGMTAAAIARFTMRMLVRPLELLLQGIEAVRQGALDPIEVSRTGDEIEIIGESFNQMIAALAASRRETAEHQEELERRIAERTEELREAMRETAAASQAKSEFIAALAQELRTPINGMLGMAELVLDGPLTPAQRAQIEAARGCARSLRVLLDSALDLCKPGAGERLDYTPRPSHEEIPDHGARRSIAHLAEALGSPEPPVGRPRVLVVDDNPVNQRVVESILQRHGCEITLAGNGAEGLARLERDRFDLVLMDIQMPTMDGLATVRAVRRDARWGDLPVVAMTAQSVAGDRERCLAAGMSAYLCKPLHAEDLVDTVDALLGRRSAAATA